MVFFGIYFCLVSIKVGGGDMMVKLTLLDWITFGVLFGIFIWLVLKMVGIINTPEWLLYLPLVGVIFAVGAFYYRMVNVAYEVKGLKKFRNETIKEIHDMKINCAKNHG